MLIVLLRGASTTWLYKNMHTKSLLVRELLSVMSVMSVVN